MHFSEETIITTLPLSKSDSKELKMVDQGYPQTGKRFEPKNMLFRYLGGTGLKVSVLGLVCRSRSIDLIS